MELVNGIEKMEQQNIENISVYLNPNLNIKQMENYTELIRDGLSVSNCLFYFICLGR